jgi:tetratricopeptide (TPR) repeat protein
MPAQRNAAAPAAASPSRGAGAGRRRSLAVVLLLASLPLAAEVRPISNAEQAAVRIAADYLDRGPAAIAENLASASPLRELPQLADEIEVRTGPREGARWELQTVVPALQERMAAFAVSYPSGFDDALLFEMVQEGGAYKVRDIRFLAQPSQKKPLFARAAPIAPTTEIHNRKPLAIALALLAAALTAAAAFLPRHRAVQLAMIAAAAALVITASAAGVLEDLDARAASASVVNVAHRDVPPRLAPLLPLRRAITLGNGNVAAIDHPIARLWKTQYDLQETHVDAAKRALAALPSPSDIPLVEILRGRLALIENNEAGAAIAFEHALNLGPGRDAIWLETAGALLSLGYDDRAAGYLARLARLGSRDADVYYSLAVLAASDGRDDEAESMLRQGWSLRPAEREQLLAADVFWSVLHRASVASAINISAATDPLVVARDACTRAITLPASAEPRTSGAFLDIIIGEQELLVPGGAALAPPGTPVVAATEWAQSEEQQHLADLPRLMISGRTAAAYAQPALRRRITATATALASRNRWPELVQLTDQLSASAEYVPPSIFFLRSIGLQRLHRDDDAKKVLVDIATSRVLQRKKDAAALTELAELFAAHDLFDAAVRMYDRSQSIRANAFIDERVRQIQMNKRLATKYYTTKTAHFEIHFPGDVSPAAAAGLGIALESELKRLQEWIPTPDFKPVVVNVVWWDEFRSTYTGSDMILGFYNGKITVPFAGVPELVPQIVAILGHELAHAMIAQATNDQAPHWFQEGLAQRIEERPYHQNAFNMYEDDRLLPVTLLDAVLHGSPDPDMIAAAYIVSQTDIRYIEAKYGRAGLRRLMNEFRAGKTTEEALAALSGEPVTQFESELRAWGHAERRVFTP